MHLRCKRCSHPIRPETVTSLVKLRCPACRKVIEFDAEERTIGNYELEVQLGAGTFGSVWKARDKSNDRRVAVKILTRQDADQGELTSMVFEARATRQLKHPHIPSIIDADREGDTLFIVREYVEGDTLDVWRKRNSPSFVESAGLCAQVAESLHYAHEMGIVHRDMKPTNIIMSPDRQPHIIDFGLSKREQDETMMRIERYRQARFSIQKTNGSRKLKSTGPVMGTPAFMSPEQARGDAIHVDRRTDIYSLGVVFYVLLTGARPFTGRNLVRQILRGRPKRPRRLNREVPPALEEICLKAMSVSPVDRFDSALQMAQALETPVEGATAVGSASSPRSPARWFGWF